jgi:hypothetical protein
MHTLSTCSPEGFHISFHAVEVVYSHGIIHAASDHPAAGMVYIYTRHALCMCAAHHNLMADRQLVGVVL